MSILATDRNATIDERLKDVALEVQKKDKTLTGFRVERTTAKSIGVGASAKFETADGTTTTVSVDSKADGKVTLTVGPPTLGEIQYTCKCDLYFAVITDQYVGKEKERLIVAVMAKPCLLGKKK